MMETEEIDKYIEEIEKRKRGRSREEKAEEIEQIISWFNERTHSKNVLKIILHHYERKCL